jgi:uncharacterized protein (TIGR02246 family)
VLSYEDRVAIDALLAGYAYAFDTGDGEAFADLFTPDGSFVNLGVATMTGREALVEFVRTDAGWRIAKRTFSSWVEAQLVDAPFAFGTT